MTKKTVFSALTGSHIRNLNDEHSDMDMKEFVYPSFDNLYDSKVIKNHSVGELIDTETHDIRRLPDLLKKGNPTYIEIMFARKVQINDNRMLEVFARNEEIARMNLPALFKASMGMYNQTYGDIRKGTSEKVTGMIEQFGYNPKKAMMAVHILATLYKYHAAGFKDYAQCVWYKDERRDYMIRVKRGAFTIAEIDEVLGDMLEKVEGVRDDFLNRPQDEATQKWVEEQVKDMVRDQLYRELTVRARYMP